MENFFYCLKSISVKNEAKQFVGVLDKYAFMGQRNTSVLSKDKVSLWSLLPYRLLSFLQWPE